MIYAFMAGKRRWGWDSIDIAPDHLWIWGRRSSRAYAWMAGRYPLCCNNGRSMRCALNGTDDMAERELIILFVV